MSNNKYGEGAYYFSLLLRLGLVMILTIGCGFFIGLVISQKFQLGVWPIFLGVFLGIFSGMLNVYRMVMKIDEKDIS